MSSSAVLAIPRLPKHELAGKVPQCGRSPARSRCRRCGCRRAGDRTRARPPRRKRRRVRAHWRRRWRIRRATGRRASAVGNENRLPSRAGVGRVLLPGRQAARIAHAARLPALRLPVPGALRGDACTANGERRRAERRGHPVADRLTGRGGEARARAGGRDGRRRRLVRRGRLLRPPARGRRGVCPRGRRAHPGGAVPRRTRGGQGRRRRWRGHAGASSRNFRSSPRSGISSTASRSRSGCSNPSSSRQSAASRRSSSSTGACSRATSVPVAMTRSASSGAPTSAPRSKTCCRG